MSDDGILRHHRLRAAQARFGCRYDELDADRIGAVDADASRSLALEDAILASAEAGGVFVPAASLDETVADVAARYDTPEDFAEDMRLNGLTQEGLREALRRELTVEIVLEKVAAAVPGACQDEIASWYAAHPERFDLPETRTARHILLTVNDGFADSHRAAAFSRIHAIRRQIDGTVETFHNLAYRHSECPTALEGGRLGRVPRGKLYPRLDAALFTLCEGSTSGVLESDMGFHIILCEKIHSARRVPFEEAHSKIRDAMNTKRRERRQALWLAALTAKKRCDGDGILQRTRQRVAAGPKAHRS